jgi:SAM-dependent methyltransferase
MRDTDADWREIGAEFPFWGVLTAPEYRQTEVPAEVIAGFYASGLVHVAETAERLQRITGQPLHLARALDFGCGAGRLTEAMGSYADTVTGVDVSPGMLAQARRHGAGKAVYTDVLPEGPFDWINSYIVFQHIPPERGMALLAQLLDRLAPGGLVSLHLTIYRDAHLAPAPPPRKRSLWGRSAGQAAQPVGAMMMYDYDMGAILAALHAHGIVETALVHEDHGGHHGEMIFGRRDQG